MKAFIIMTLASLISITSFAKAELQMECVNKLDQQDKLSVYTGKVGEGGNGILISYDINMTGKPDGIVTRKYDLQWHTAGGAGLGKNVRTLGYSNQSYGKKAHDVKNILHDLEIVMTYSKANDEHPKKTEATLVKAMNYKDTGDKTLRLDAVATNYNCELKIQD